MEIEKYWLGVDIGGTSIKIALINQSGEIFHLNRIGIDDIKHSIEAFLLKLVDSIQSTIHLSNQNVNGIGISLPGLQMENGSGALFSINLPIINGINIRDYIEENTQLRTVVTCDIVAHSLAEQKFGAGKNVKNFLSVSLGTGIGHTFIKDGTPFIITNGLCGDSGRMILDQCSALQDSSGVIGTAEALCGVKAIETLANNMYPTGKSYSAREIISLAKSGKDPVSREIMMIISRHLAHYLFNLSVIYFPDVISITGGQTEAGKFFIVECQKEFNQLSSKYFIQCFKMIGRNKPIKIVKSKLGGLTGLQGSIIPLIAKSI